jgi:hypothetical protein
MILSHFARDTKRYATGVKADGKRTRSIKKTESSQFCAVQREADKALVLVA